MFRTVTVYPSVPVKTIPVFDRLPSVMPSLHLVSAREYPCQWHQSNAPVKRDPGL
jgi:hypothetical protein